MTVLHDRLRAGARISSRISDHHASRCAWLRVRVRIGLGLGLGLGLVVVLVLVLGYY